MLQSDNLSPRNKTLILIDTSKLDGIQRKKQNLIQKEKRMKKIYLLTVQLSLLFISHTSECIHRVDYKTMYNKKNPRAQQTYKKKAPKERSQRFLQKINRELGKQKSPQKILFPEPKTELCIPMISTSEYVSKNHTPHLQVTGLFLFLMFAHILTNHQTAADMFQQKDMFGKPLDLNQRINQDFEERRASADKMRAEMDHKYRQTVFSPTNGDHERMQDANRRMGVERMQRMGLR